MQGATGYTEVTKLEAVGMEWKIVICRKSIIQSFFISKYVYNLSGVHYVCVCSFGVIEKYARLEWNMFSTEDAKSVHKYS